MHLRDALSVHFACIEIYIRGNDQCNALSLLTLVFRFDVIFHRRFGDSFCKGNEHLWHHANKETVDFQTPTFQRETDTALDMLLTGYHPERRAHATLVAPAWKSPTVQSKVTIPPQAMSSCSMGGIQAQCWTMQQTPMGRVLFPKPVSIMWWGVPQRRPGLITCGKWPSGWKCVETLREEYVPWWQLVVPVMDAGTTGTQELAKCFLAMWQWTVEVAATNFCLPAPTMLYIGQFLDEKPKEGDHTPWLLAYARALQHVGEAIEERMWHPIGMHLTP